MNLLTMTLFHTLKAIKYDNHAGFFDKNIWFTNVVYKIIKRYTICNA